MLNSQKTIHFNGIDPKITNTKSHFQKKGLLHFFFRISNFKKAQKRPPEFGSLQLLEQKRVSIFSIQHFLPNSCRKEGWFECL